MCKEKRKVPKLRFPGFTEDWEQRKLGELTISIGDGLHGTPKYDENGSYYFINGNNLVDSKVSVTEETKKVAFEALSNDDRRLDSTSILMSINGTIGTLARYNNENIMLGKSVAYITPKNINRDFLFYQLQGDVIQSYFYKNLTGTTIKNLGLGTIKNAIVMSTLSEEEFKIGQLFYKLDQYITLHQRKLEHLNLKKKALLQKLFPKNGECYPELRFPGFTDAWEQRKFSEITYLSGIKNKENKPYESYSISNEFGFIPQNEQFEHGGTMKTADKSMYYIVTQNSFAYNPARINVGSIGYYDKPDNVIVSSLYEVFKTTEIVNDKFLWHWFKSNQFNHLIEKYQEGGVRLYFYYDKLCKGAIELPTIDEQNKISNLLNGLDLFITLHQRKLDHLQLQKKALLQQMFV